jgi:superfamily II DNA or RNA helicase
MLTKAEIAKVAFYDAYKGGEELYKSGGHRHIAVEEEDELGGVMIAGEIKDGKEYYDTCIGIEENSAQIFDYSCNCFEERKYWGMCKHCVTLALIYLRKRDMEAEQMSARKSTYGLARMLQRYSKKASIHMYFENTNASPVKLEPVVQFPDISHDNLQISFRLGRGRMYIVKDIMQLLEHIKYGHKHSYGKELEFIHGMEAFDEESKNWIAFIQRVTYPERYYSGFKHLNISGARVEDFFTLLAGQQFLAKEMYEKKEQLWEISMEPPELFMEMVGKNEGVELKVDMPRMLRGEAHLFFWYNKKVYCTEWEKYEPLKEFFQFLKENNFRDVYIAKPDLTVFVEEILPLIQERMNVKMTTFQPAVYQMAKPEFKFYVDSPQVDMVMCKVIAIYEHGEYNIFDKETQKKQRNAKEESRVRYQINRYFNAFSPTQKELAITQQEDGDMLYEFLTEGLSILQKLGEVYLSDEIKKMQVYPTAKVQVGLSIQGDLLELTIDSPEISMEHLTEILSRYSRKKKYYRMKNGSFIQVKDTNLETLLRMKEDLRITDAQMKEGKVELPAYRALYLDHVLKETEGELYANRDKHFRALIRNMKTVEESDYEVPSELEETLRSYQKIGYKWLKTLQKNGFGAILADDMGLGKTIQAITLLLSQWQESRKGALIVCPASLIYNWKNELSLFAPKLPSILVAGSADARKEVIKQAEKDTVLITSYELLRRDIEWYQDMVFGCEIIDEAQNIKNHSTKAAKAVKMIRAEFKLALTGTPIENRLSELWSIFDYLMPGFLYSYSQFRQELESPILQKQDETATKRLTKLISPFVLRRTKKEVLKDLPDKIEKNLFAQMEGEQKELYDAHVNRLRLLLDNQSEEEFKNGKIQILTELTRLRQLCCDPALVYEDYNGESAKAELCIEYLQNAVTSGHKVLLFSQFTSMLARLATRMEQVGISHYTLNGSTPKRRRMELVEAFNRDNTQVFCISLRAGGTGLNLTAADMVIHYDPWWNVAVQNQATDRAHRIGQKKVVNVYKMVVAGTIEENILKLQEKKHHLAEEILSGEQVSTASFTKEELLELLV